MIQREFEKLYSGNIASIRDTELSKAIKAGGMVFIYKGKKMTMTADELRKYKFQCHKQTFRSRYYPSQKYTLYDFVFIDDKERVKEEGGDDRQLRLF